jgi:hypothetical protein
MIPPYSDAADPVTEVIRPSVIVLEVIPGALDVSLRVR